MPRGAILLLAALLLPSLAEAKKARATHHARKMRVSREKAISSSLAAWPDQARRVFQIDPMGVPELDRLLTDRPPVGVAVVDPTDGMELPSGRMASEPRPDGLAASLFSAATDPVKKLKAVAMPLLGSPYRTGGEGASGFDCSGLVRTLLRSFGQSLAGRSSPEFWKQGAPVDKTRLQAGDLLFFSDHHRSIGHVAMYLSDGKFVHASVGSGVIVSALDEEYYRRRYKGARRLTEFARQLWDPSDSVAATL
jgi:cell wall-associated NlpC family hydrolase